jgi:hypothetical protein
LALEPTAAAFSPNGDGVRDETYFALGTEGVDRVFRWRLEIRNVRAERVRLFEGSGPAPGLTEWRGEDQNKLPVPDGDYRVVARVWGERFQALSKPFWVSVDRRPPELRVSTPATPGTPLFLDGKDRGGLEKWTLAILPVDRGGDPVRSAEGVFVAGSARWTWDLRGGPALKPVPNGGYRAVLQAVDRAGNHSSPVERPLEVRVPAEEVLHDVSVVLPVRRVEGGWRLTWPGEGVPADQDGDIVRFLAAFPAATAVVTVREKDAGRAQARAWALYRRWVEAGMSPLRLTARGEIASSGAGEVEVNVVLPEERP